MGHLTSGERQKLAKLRRQTREASSPAEAFVLKAVREVAREERQRGRKRIKWGIVVFLAILIVNLLVWS